MPEAIHGSCCGAYGFLAFGQFVHNAVAVLS